MKKAKIGILFLLAVVFALPACKKGANDPFISLKSRDARITAKWKLTNITKTETQVVSGITITETYAYDGSNMTHTVTGSSSNSATGTFEMEIIKDGTMTWSSTYTPSGGSADVQSSTGEWQWLDSDKDKSVILLSGGGSLFGGGLWMIDKLASKELVLKNVGNSTDNGDTDNWDFAYTFEKQ